MPSGGLPRARPKALLRRLPTTIVNNFLKVVFKFLALFFQPQRLEPVPALSQRPANAA